MANLEQSELLACEINRHNNMLRQKAMLDLLAIEVNEAKKACKAPTSTPLCQKKRKPPSETAPRPKRAKRACTLKQFDCLFFFESACPLKKVECLDSYIYSRCR